MSYIAPPIAVVFLFGILWRRANSYGAFSVMIIGFILGMGRLIMEAIFISNPSLLSESSDFIRPVLETFVKSNFLNFR